MKNTKKTRKQYVHYTPLKSVNTLSLLLMISLKVMADTSAGSGQCYRIYESVILKH